MRDVRFAARSIGIGLALLVLVTVTAVAASPNLSERDFNRLGAADRAALTNLGLVMQRGCDADDVPCMNEATAKEIPTKPSIGRSLGAFGGVLGLTVAARGQCELVVRVL